MERPTRSATERDNRNKSKDLLLASRKYAQEQPLKSWWCLLSTILIYAAALTGAVWASPLPWAWAWALRIFCSIVTGLVMVRLFVLYHDHQHGTILRHSRIANGWMTIYGILTLNPPSIWNRSHNHHHKHTAKVFGADIGSYPVMTTEIYARSGRGKRFGYAAARHPLTIAAGYLTIFLYGMCVRSLLNKPREHYDSAIAIVAHLAIAVWMAWMGWGVLVMGLLIPSTIAAAMGAYLFYAQHNYPGVILQPRADWDYVTAALKSSSFIRMSPIMHWFTGNIGYHHVHHLNARIPFYRLPEAMAAMPALQSPGTTSLRPWDVVKCLRLKLWDGSKNSLVPFEG